MKSPIYAIILSFIISAPAWAAPQILLEAEISKKNAKGGEELLSQPSLVALSGTTASIQIGKHKYLLTPTLLADGQVEIQAHLTEQDGEKVHTLSKVRTIVDLDKEFQVSVGQQTLTVKPSLATNRD
ncbi:MAG: hypothetical protein AAFY98_09735 [Verrucomicrobiota bacterium]